MPRQLDDWIEAYLTYTDITEPPRTYREWVACSVLAAVLQRKCFLEWGHITFYPNMYIVLVGPSGKCRKGTAMGVGAKFLRELQESDTDYNINLTAEAITREALIRAIGKSQTITEIDGILYDHASITIYSQELTVFLGYNNIQLMMDITDWFDCRDRWEYETKTQGKDVMKNMYVNLIGATTPKLIQSTLPIDAHGGGLTSRIIFVYEEQRGRKVALPFLTDEDRKLEKKLLNDLKHISRLHGGFKISKDFGPAYKQWYDNQEETVPFDDSNLDGYVSRRPRHLLSLCMIRTVAKSDNLVLTKETFEQSLEQLRLVEQKMPRAFAGYGRGQSSEVQADMMAFIAKRGRVERSELYRVFYKDLDNLDHLVQMLEAIEGFNFIEQKHNGQGQTFVEYKEDNDLDIHF